MVDIDNDKRRNSAIEPLLERVMRARPQSAEYVEALIDASDKLAAIDATLAERTTTEACHAAERLADGALLAKALSRSAWQCCQMGGSLEHALISAERARFIAERIGDPKAKHSAQFVLAWIRSRIGDVQTAESAWRALIVQAEQTQNALLEAKSRLMLGTLLKQLMRYGEAIAEQRLAFALYERSHDHDRAMCANNLAMTLIECGQHSEALQWVNRAIALCPPGVTIWMSVIEHTHGCCQRAQDNLPAASECFATSLALLNSPADDVNHAATLYLDIGRLHTKMANPAESLTWLHRALALTVRHKLLALETRAHSALYKAYVSIGALEQAIEQCTLRNKTLARNTDIAVAESASVLRAVDRVNQLRPQWVHDIVQHRR
jgi:tetratricopeptide (TPR) repeat protein